MLNSNEWQQKHDQFLSNSQSLLYKSEECLSHLEMIGDDEDDAKDQDEGDRRQERAQEARRGEGAHHAAPCAAASSKEDWRMRLSESSWRGRSATIEPERKT